MPTSTINENLFLLHFDCAASGTQAAETAPVVYASSDRGDNEIVDDPCTSPKRAHHHDNDSRIDQPPNASSCRLPNKKTTFFSFYPAPVPFEELDISTREVQSSSSKFPPALSKDTL